MNIVSIIIMGKTLVIIESSGSKMKKMEKILGSEYIVKASMGHIKTLKGKGDGIIPEENYKMCYELIRDKSKNSSALKKLATSDIIDNVIIATDRDREGEAIGYHICQYLGLDVEKTQRLIFNAIDKKSITNALKNISVIDMNIVHEQMARACIDYLIGFGISPVVSRKIGKLGLSAGRVQSVVLKMIIDKEKEIETFEESSHFNVKGKFLGKDDLILDAILKEKFKDVEELKKFMEHCLTCEFILDKSISVKKSIKPPSPYITSTLIQDIGKRFGLNSKQTMMIAQRLYEQGKITYMRTDCAYIVPEFQEQIGEYIKENFGDDYIELRQYQSSDKNAQEAHECIRVTDVSRERLNEEVESIERKVYRAIWVRTVASQMANKLCRVITVPIIIIGRDETFEAKAEEILFEGFSALYRKSEENDADSESDLGSKKVEILKNLKEGDKIIYDIIKAEEKRKRPPARYDDVTITKQMESSGIGRPSTYHTMIPKLLNREYVVIDTREVLSAGELKVFEIVKKCNKIEERNEKCKAEIDKKKLFPTDIGRAVSGFLDEQFKLLFDYDYTAKMERELDKICEGKIKWKEFVRESHMIFKEQVDLLMGKFKEVKKDDNRRYLGDIEGEKVYCYEAKYGPVVLIGEKYLPLKNKKLIDTLTLDQVKKMPKFPIILGQKDGEDIILRDGRYGLYIVWKGNNYNIPKGVEIDMVGLDIANQLIEDKDKKVIREFGPKLKIMNGPYGVYINWNGCFASLSEDINIDELDEETCIGIVKALGKSKKNSTIKSKKKK